ncbi:MAG: hypothetical protein AAF419_00200 [Pseudomonadota bacterium]
MFLSLLFTACSDGENSSNESDKDHVWKEQTDSIEKAKEVESMLKESEKSMKDAIDKQLN